MRIPYFQIIGVGSAIVTTTLGLITAEQTLAQNSPAPVGCGQYGLFLNVTDEAGNSIHAVYPRLTPTGEHIPQDVQLITGKVFERTTTLDYRGFRFLLNGNEQPRGIYTLYVTAADYLPFEKEITFPYCRNQRVDIQLKLQSGKKPVRRVTPPKKKPVMKSKPVKKPTSQAPKAKSLPSAVDTAL